MSALSRCFAATVAVATLSLFAIPTTVTPAAARGEIVAFNGEGSAGTIVVRTSQRRLYFVLGDGRALAYPVGVGRAGRQWAGRAIISGKHVKPAWQAPPDIARERPDMARVIPGGSP